LPGPDHLGWAAARASRRTPEPPACGTAAGDGIDRERRPRLEAAQEGRRTGRDGATISVKPIRIFGDPVLRTPADPVTDFDAELRRLVKDLTDTMLDAPGVGLAAPQIGVGLRVFTYHVDDQLGHLINPSLDLSPNEETDDEGCLSFPGLVFPVKRAYGVVAKGFNMHGEPVTLEGSGHLARCVQHETDHLDGVLFIDRLDPVARKLAMREIREADWWGEPAPQVKVSPHRTWGKAF
ncbi:MAG TPA: peptide deformylase, partial [Streptosporangiaceae bacterium]